VLCVQNHVEHERHIPECIQNIIRSDIANLAQKVEFSTHEGRPSHEFWETYDKKSLVQRSLNRHRKAGLDGLVWTDKKCFKNSS